MQRALRQQSFGADELLHGADLTTRRDYDQMTFAELADASDAALRGFTRREVLAAEQEVVDRQRALDAAVKRKKTELHGKARPLVVMLGVGAVALVVAVFLTFVQAPDDANLRHTYFWAAVLSWGVTVVVGSVVLGFFVAGSLASNRARPIGQAQPTGVKAWRTAEEDVAAWLSFHVQPAQVGAGTQDGGVDVRTASHVVQVKDWSSNLGAPAIRQIYGVATAEGKQAMVFAKTGYTTEALRFARQAGVKLYVGEKGSYRAV